MDIYVLASSIDNTQALIDVRVFYCIMHAFTTKRRVSRAIVIALHAVRTASNFIYRVPLISQFIKSTVK